MSASHGTVLGMTTKGNLEETSTEWCINIRYQFNKVLL